MTRMPREPEAFGEQVAKILHRQYPDHSIDLAGPMDVILGGKHLALENLYRMVLHDPNRGLEIVEDYLDRLMEGDAMTSISLPLSVAQSRIMPRIQPVSIFNHLDRAQVAYVPFVNDTVIVFVIDMPLMTVSITVEQLIKWGLTADDLDDIARKNLMQYAPRFEIQLLNSNDGGRAAMISLQDGYDAARLLLSILHERLAPELSGDFFVATPARDMFLALSSKPADFVARIRKRVSHDYQRLPYPITKQLFVVTQDGVAGTVQNEAA